MRILRFLPIILVDNQITSLQIIRSTESRERIILIHQAVVVMIRRNSNPRVALTTDLNSTTNPKITISTITSLKISIQKRRTTTRNQKMIIGKSESEYHVLIYIRGGHH